MLSKYSADDFAEHYNNSRGMACVFSLKNPTYPEYTCLSSCAMSCVDVNPFHAHMLAIGLVDGNVAVYNLQVNTQKPSHMSNARNGKHRQMVTQVRVFRTQKCIVKISSLNKIHYSHYLHYYSCISGNKDIHQIIN